MANEDPNGELGVLLNGELHIVAGIASVSFRFLQYMLALRRSGRLTESAYQDLKRFQVDTNGEYTIFNIPTQDPEKVELFLEQLRNAGVAFCELPDLNLRDGIVQIAVRNRDVAKWQYVQDEYLMNQLCGGQFSLKELSAMTGGQYNIVSIGLGDNTLEGSEQLQEFKRCLDGNKVNYAILPDLRYGDGKVQFAYVPSDHGRFKQAIRDYEMVLARKWAEERGEPVESVEPPDLEISSMDYEEYRETSEVKMHEYLKNRDTETKAEIDQVLQEHKENASVKTENFRYALEQDQEDKSPTRAEAENVSAEKNIPVIGNRRRYGEDGYRNEIPYSSPVYQVAESGSGGSASEENERYEQNYQPSREHIELYQKYDMDLAFEQFSLPPDSYRDFKEQYNMCFVRLQDTDQYVAVLAFAPDEHGVRCFIEPEREYGIFRFEHGALKRCADKIVGAVLAAEIGRMIAPEVMPKGIRP